MKIRMIKGKRMSPPALHFEFFRNNMAAWNSLKEGKTVDVPLEVANNLNGVEVVHEAEPAKAKEDKEVK